MTDSPWSSVPRLIHLAETYRAAGNPRAALDPLRAALEEVPDDPGLLVIYARTLIDTKQHDEAERALITARAINPEDADGHLVQSLIHLHRNEFGRAQTECDLALALDPEMADAHFIRGMVLQTYHQDAEAEAAFLKAIELAPTSPAIAVALARLKHRRGQGEAAAAVLAQIDEPGQSHPEYILMMGQMAFDAQRLDEAYDRAIWVLQNNPDDDEAVLLLAKVKFSRSGISGWPFRLSFWFDARPVWLRVVLAVVGILAFVACASRWRAGARDLWLLVPILGVMAAAAFAWMRSHLLGIVVKRELRSVKLKDF
ncbi:MAG: tetratricopeptide repeat protein [Hyphomicrobiaceae bacterium]